MGQHIYTNLACTGLLLTATALQAGSSLYPPPPMPHYEAEDEQLNCYELEQQLALKSAETYSDKPGFYEDPYHAASLWSGMLWEPGAWGYLAYSGAAEYGEYSRIHQALARIEALRQLKANKRCHEK